MPYYQITVRVKQREAVVVRQDPESDIERVWHRLELASKKKYGEDLKHFSLVMISKRSKAYGDFLAAQNKSQKKPAPESNHGVVNQWVPGAANKPRRIKPADHAPDPNQGSLPLGQNRRPDGA